MQILNDGFGTRHISTTAGILTSELLQHGKQNTMQATHIHKNEHNKNGICQLRNWTQSSSTAALGIFAFLFHHITYLSLLESGIKTGKWASYLALWSISSSTSESIKLRKKKHYPPMPSKCWRHKNYKKKILLRSPFPNLPVSAFVSLPPFLPPRRLFSRFLYVIHKKVRKSCRDQDSNLGYCGHNAGS